MSDNDKLLIEVFTDYVCPWCYLSSVNVKQLQHRQQVTIRWIPYPLHPDTPEEGMLLTELLPGRDLESIHRRLYSMMDDAGLEYGDRRMTYNSRLAQELGMWADTLKGGDKLHDRLYRAYFVHDRNLAHKETLLQAVAEADLDQNAAEEVIDTRSFSKAVDAQWSRARAMGISGVPCFVGEGYMMTGCQPYEELEKFVQYLEIQKLSI